MSLDDENVVLNEEDQHDTGSVITLTIDARHTSDEDKRLEVELPSGETESQIMGGGKKRKSRTDMEDPSNDIEDSNGLLPRRKRFIVLSYEDSFKWSLPSTMADYINTNIRKYIPDKDLFKNIFYLRALCNIISMRHQN